MGDGLEVNGIHRSSEYSSQRGCDQLRKSVEVAVITSLVDVSLLAGVI